LLVLRILRRMTDKELIKQLNTLKNIKPEAAWIGGNRDVLLSQISNSGARELSAGRILMINLNSFFKTVAQPAYALGVFLLVMVGAGLYGHQAFTGTKPNDSLYIARVISERAKLSTVFNSEDRNKLAVKFSLEHAKDISTVLADPAFNNEANQDQVARLSESFNREIENVKTRISYLKPKQVVKSEEASSLPVENFSEEEVFSMAEANKAEAGLQVLISPIAKTEPLKSIVTSTTSLNQTSSTTSELTSPSTVTALIIEEAKQLSENKYYQKASEKLQEVSDLIK